MESSSFVSGSMVTAQNEKGVNLGTPGMLAVFAAFTLTMPCHLQLVVLVFALVILMVLGLLSSIMSTPDSLIQLICAPESTSMGLRPIASWV